MFSKHYIIDMTSSLRHRYEQQEGHTSEHILYTVYDI